MLICDVLLVLIIAVLAFSVNGFGVAVCITIMQRMYSATGDATIGALARWPTCAACTCPRPRAGLRLVVDGTLLGSTDPAAYPVLPSAPEFGGKKTGSGGSRLAESEGGVWF